MKKIISMLLCICLLLSGCDMIKITVTVKHPKEPLVQTEPTEPQPGPIQPQRPVEEGSQVLMLYMIGSNLESQYALATHDIDEIVDCDYDTDNMTLLICAGGATFWWTSEISPDECGIYTVKDGELTQLHTLSNQNMVSNKTLTEFLDYGYETYAAESYSLIMWDHGGGAVLGFGMDQHYENDSLTLEEMGKALKKSQLIKDGNRLEWIGFDACLMGMAEMANLMSNYTNYLIASEETEPGCGWNYKCLKALSDGRHNDGKSAGKVILSSYEAQLKELYDPMPDYTLSLLDLKKTDATVAALEDLVEVAHDDLLTGSYSRIAKVRNDAKSFGKISEDSIYDTVDLYDLSHRLKKLYPKQAQALQDAVEDLVVDQVTNVEGAHGVAVYFPFDNKEYIDPWLKVYETTGFSPVYTDFIRDFSKTLSGEPLINWDINKLTPVEDVATPGEYYVMLTPEQMEHFSQAKYSIWEKENNRPHSHICWLVSYDVDLSPEGKLSSGFEGKIFYVGDTSGNRFPVTAIEMERTETYSKYYISLIVSYIDEFGEFQIENVYVHIRFDAEHPEGQILGCYLEINADSNMYPNRGTFELREGMTVGPFLLSRAIKYREDGTVAPPSEWESTLGIGSSFDLNGELTVTVEDAEHDNEVLCFFHVYDTQDNLFMTNPVYVRK